MTVDEKMDALRAAIAEAQKTLDAAVAERDAATDTDDVAPAAPAKSPWQTGAEEARRRHPRREVTGTADGDAQVAPTGDQSAAAGRAEAYRRDGRR
jgi:hypothetical protein